ncbi:type II toxin-antitoxin system RelE/ParE family toxin [Endozoicomonas sp. GU-1]|uniref:type II toxin-antitoxin system RelE/ParE family toxin n=1 Tax=Endozoicomonas sp. GU-1 TaxID=3009078 RepID=UPI0022B502C0|nr:type II toxin-antitoxin system RelE/ParE family toxin [Endozoicomonas sp. GU-1]WBA83286.1 type II toxin-antitoxin system RelE/ParE family toxin [Endozoicomonas sp. GU-1]WBA86215.1 type II toxin-antitoxin system RelE/ParE family toxin [Endozoicomonas sp. GU-1]
MSELYRFHPVAIAQQEEIWLFTYKHWGEKQADLYIDGLHQYLTSVARNHALLKALPESIISGVSFLRYKKHYVFVKSSDGAQSEVLYVLSILHSSMDLPARLNELLDEL